MDSLAADRVGGHGGDCEGAALGDIDSMSEVSDFRL